MPFQPLSASSAAARLARAASISCSRSSWACSASGMRPSSQPSSVTSAGVAPAGIGYLPARSCSTAACATASCFSSSARRSAGERSWTAGLIDLGALPEHPLQQRRRERRTCRQRQGQHEGCRPVGPGRDHAPDSTEFVPSGRRRSAGFEGAQARKKAAVEAAASAAVGTVYTVPHPCSASRIS